ncbi:MAG: hypothetical protein QW728_02810 [Thermoplasmata archaeon]
MDEDTVKMIEKISISLDKLVPLLERIAIALEKREEIISHPSHPENRICKNINGNKKGDAEIDKESSEKNVREEKNQLTIPDNSNTFIVEYLSRQNISIKYIPPKNDFDAYLDRVATYMGNNYSRIKLFLEQIKSRLNLGDSVRIDLKERSQEEISAICRVATDLHEIAFLEEYKYLKSPKYLLYAKPNKIPEAISFMSGKWLERYVRRQIISILNELNPAVKYSYISNPRIELPNNDEFELDLLFEIEGEIYWFECKSGDYQRFLKKYSEISKLLNLDEGHTFMILTEINDASINALRSLFKIHLTKIEKFPAEFLEIVVKKLNASSSQINTEKNNES